MNLKPNILIFSVFEKKSSLFTNKENHWETLENLRRSGIPAMGLEGKYKGEDELSILVEGFENRALVKSFVDKFNQECYLESHNDRHTNLVFPDGSTQSVGILTPVSKEEAKSKDSYSYSPVVGQYFITK